MFVWTSYVWNFCIPCLSRENDDHDSKVLRLSETEIWVYSHRNRFANQYMIGPICAMLPKRTQHTSVSIPTVSQVFENLEDAHMAMKEGVLHGDVSRTPVSHVSGELRNQVWLWSHLAVQP